MANENKKVEEQNCNLQPFERNRYFYGKLLTVRDFEVEQQYGMEKDASINRLIHGVGIVFGLEIDSLGWKNNKLTITLTDGVALDCCGNEIVVTGCDGVEVQGNLQPGKPHYIYLKYATCMKDPVPVVSNASACAEECCYSRIKETYEVCAEPQSPAQFTGTVVEISFQITEKSLKALESEGVPEETRKKLAPLKDIEFMEEGEFLAALQKAIGEDPNFKKYQSSILEHAKKTNGGIYGAKVEALIGGVVRAVTFADRDGKYTLVVAAETYDVRAGSSRHQSEEKSDQKATPGTPTDVDFELNKEDNPGPPPICPEVTQDYYDNYLKVCPNCNDPKVLLAVVDIPGGEGKAEINAETRKYRSIVYSNPMLHDLLCDHVADFNNPHHTTAEQIGALETINGVGYAKRKPPLNNVELVSDDKDPTIEFKKDVKNKQIMISTRPAQSVTSVARTPVVGASKKYSPEDHVHDLADGVVTSAKIANDAVLRTHLNADVIKNLLTSDNTITIEPKEGEKKIMIRTKPGTSVQSVGLRSNPGTLDNFAREDHVHDLRINGQGPAKGEFVLTPGENIKIDPGRAKNELVISATGGGKAAATVTSVGRDRVVGEMTTFAREDHVHNLADNAVTTRAIQSENVTADKIDRKALRSASRGLVITSPVTTPSIGTVAEPPAFVFTLAPTTVLQMTSGQVPISVTGGNQVELKGIQHRLKPVPGSGRVVITLGIITEQTTPPETNLDKTNIFVGDVALVDGPPLSTEPRVPIPPIGPALVARLNKDNPETFDIILQKSPNDRRKQFVVVWWAIGMVTVTPP